MAAKRVHPCKKKQGDANASLLFNDTRPASIGTVELHVEDMDAFFVLRCLMDIGAEVVCRDGHPVDRALDQHRFGFSTHGYRQGGAIEVSDDQTDLLRRTADELCIDFAVLLN